jgi:hypothetical protein
MSQAQNRNITIPNRFHNLANEMLADALGRADAVLKGAEAEVAAIKAEIKQRGILEAAGDHFTVKVTEQISGRLDAKAVREFLGDTYFKFENAVVSTVIRIKAVNRLAAAAA